MFKVNDVGGLTTRQHNRRMTEREQRGGAREQQRDEGGGRGHEDKAQGDNAMASTLSVLSKSN